MYKFYNDYMRPVAGMNGQKNFVGNAFIRTPRMGKVCFLLGLILIKLSILYFSVDNKIAKNSITKILLQKLNISTGNKKYCILCKKDSAKALLFTLLQYFLLQKFAY